MNCWWYTCKIFYTGIDHKYTYALCMKYCEVSVTNMGTVKNFEAIPNEFNMAVCTRVISSSQK
jgi:hypothetical protein